MSLCTYAYYCLDFTNYPRQYLRLLRSMVFLDMNTDLMSIMGSIYIAEISSPKYRSIFVTMTSVICMFGVESQYAILL